jgi:ElaB/YqjD/DUF883 family membrane-anchored ribosome-binding protein
LNLIGPLDTCQEAAIMENTNIGSEKLMQDLKAVVRDTEQLMKATAGDASESVSTARARAAESLHQAKERLIEIEQDLAARARAAAQATNAYVHENPWPSIGVAAGAGFVVGLLIGRRHE